MRHRTLGRCPDCGESAPVAAHGSQAAEILPHECQARACEYTGCLVTRQRGEMIQFPLGAWYCAPHALIAVGCELVALHRAGADHASFLQLLEVTLPAVLERFPEALGRTPRPSRKETT